MGLSSGNSLLENLNRSDRLWHLSRASIFSGLDPEDLEVVARRARDRVYQEGKPIFTAGEPARELFILNRGTVRLFLSSPDQREKTLEILRGGESFGLEAVRDGASYQVSASGHEDCWVSVLERADLFALSRSCPALAANLTGILLDRLAVAYDQIAGLSFLEIEQRLARTLLHLAERHGQSANGRSDQVRLKLRVTHDILARLTGANRPYLSNILSQFRKAGWIRYQGESLVVDVGMMAAVERRSNPVSPGKG
jgi:CRP/FNR family transcriptional regulator